MNFKDMLRSALMPNPTLPLPPNKQMGATLYGDSIMAIVADRRWVGDPILRTAQNMSQPGDTAANAWRRFAYDTRHTDIVVLQHGTNDLSRGDDPIPYLRDMAKYAMAEGRQVVFTGLTQRADGRHVVLNNFIVVLAAELGCRTAGWWLEPLGSADGLHPSEAMSRSLAERLALTLGSL